MIMIPPIAITDSNFVSSSVDDVVEVLNVYATGTITCGNDDPVLGQTMVIGPQTFTVVATRTGTGEIQRDTKPNTFASRIKTAIDADIPDYVSCAIDDNVLTLTSILEGTEGNVTFTSGITGVTVSGSGALAGGVDYVAGYHEWDDETTYDIGDVVVVTTEHHLYESLRVTNLNNSPPTNLTGEDPYWLDLGPTNRWRMFDPPYTHTYNAVVASRTVQAESIVVALTPGAIDAVALINCNASSINITLNDGTERYNKTITPVSTAARNYTALDLPDDYPTATLAVTITNTGANATCGVLVCGLQKDMGTTRANPGPEIGIIDYSIKEQDDFGNWSITPRDNAKRNTYGILIPVADHSEVKRLLAEYRSTPVVWDGNGANTDYSILRNYGLVSDWDMHVTNGFAELSLEIEGLT